MFFCLGENSEDSRLPHPILNCHFTWIIVSILLSLVSQRSSGFIPHYPKVLQQHVHTQQVHHARVRELSHCQWFPEEEEKVKARCPYNVADTHEQWSHTERYLIHVPLGWYCPDLDFPGFIYVSPCKFSSSPHVDSLFMAQHPFSQLTHIHTNFFYCSSTWKATNKQKISPPKKKKKNTSQIVSASNCSSPLPYNTFFLRCL